MEKHVKDKRVFLGSYSWPSAPSKPQLVPRAEASSKDSKVLDKGESVVKEFFNKLDGKRCFKCQGYGHFQAGYPNRMAPTM